MTISHYIWFPQLIYSWMLFVEVGIPVKIHNIIRLDVQMYIRLCIRLIWTDVILNFEDMIQGLNFFPKVHWSRSSEHQESTGSEKCSTGPEYRNGGNKIC